MGVRFIEELDTSGESWKKLDELKEYKEGGRIEVFQEGEWQKICTTQLRDQLLAGLRERGVSEQHLSFLQGMMRIKRIMRILRIKRIMKIMRIMKILKMKFIF